MVVLFVALLAAWPAMAECPLPKRACEAMCVLKGADAACATACAECVEPGAPNLLSTLPAEDVAWLARTGERRTLAPGARVIRHGEQVLAVMVVLDGALEVTHDGANLAKLDPGAVVGEVTLVDEGLASATVAAAGDTTVLSIPKPLLRARLSSDDAFSARFHKALATVLAQRLRAANEARSDK
ncbi:MAG: cyclic nucleotide-binding domain-containing protein [Alphaproteobacteria bacterium]|nr:cyclic nucleotide-binding domain-containing protein [Alphaproteobacteria bacterium]